MIGRQTVLLDAEKLGSEACSFVPDSHLGTRGRLQRKFLAALKARP